VNYARRQQYRRVSRAGRLGLTSTAAAVLGPLLVAKGAAVLGAVSLVIAVVLGFRARHWLSLAGRSRVGARSEDEVRRMLDRLRRMGWCVRHSMSWRAGGDIDSVVRAPGGVAFVIETKTRGYDPGHVARVHDQAMWLRRRRRRWCRNGVLPVLCIVRARGLQRWEHGVLVTSLDHLVPALTALADDARWLGR
jgi:hypothetical protein